MISSTLLARTKFLPAKILNLLAAAWIQFETHDWFNHGEPPADDPFEVPLEDGDAWHECPMRVRRTRPDPTRDYAAERSMPAAIAASSPRRPPTSTPSRTGGTPRRSTAATPRPLQPAAHRPPDGQPVPDGKLFLDGENSSLDPSNSDVALSGFTGNWWLGLSLLHTLFTREHNAICDRLRREYPYWADDQVFGVARLVNSALMAKIHTVEWTPAILGHPALQVGMDANWWGLAGEKRQEGCSAGSARTRRSAASPARASTTTGPTTA